MRLSQPATGPFFSCHAPPDPHDSPMISLKSTSFSLSLLLATAATVSPVRAAEKDINTLTDAEKAAGWQLLFNGKDFSGWHNFKRATVRPGWQVVDGTLACNDPHNAGDIVTSNKFDWFELQIDYNISEAGNSGIMYHVTDAGDNVWATGPEFQLEDNVKAADPVRCGWLYALYQPPIDPATGKTLDATKPVGQWNHVRLLVTPEKCVHEINGVKSSSTSGEAMTLRPASPRANSPACPISPKPRWATLPSKAITARCASATSRSSRSTNRSEGHACGNAPSDVRPSSVAGNPHSNVHRDPSPPVGGPELPFLSGASARIQIPCFLAAFLS